MARIKSIAQSHVRQEIAARIGMSGKRIVSRHGAAPPDAGEQTGAGGDGASDIGAADGDWVQVSFPRAFEGC